MSLPHAQPLDEARAQFHAVARALRILQGLPHGDVRGPPPEDWPEA